LQASRQILVILLLEFRYFQQPHMIIARAEVMTHPHQKGVNVVELQLAILGREICGNEADHTRGLSAEYSSQSLWTVSLFLRDLLDSRLGVGIVPMLTPAIEDVRSRLHGYSRNLSNLFKSSSHVSPYLAARNAIRTF
jgi:hypothetical protein